MKKLFILLMFINFSCYAKEIYLFDYYSYIDDYYSIGEFSKIDQIQKEKKSNFKPIIDELLSQHKEVYIATFVGNAVGDINKKYPSYNIFQCELPLDSFILKLNDFINDKQNYIIDVDQITYYQWTTCPTEKYNYYKNIITKNKDKFIHFFINEHDRSFDIVQKLIKELKINKYQIYRKYYFTYHDDDSLSIINFQHEAELINNFNMSDNLKKMYQNQLLQEQGIPWNSFRYIWKNKFNKKSFDNFKKDYFQKIKLNLQK